MLQARRGRLVSGACRLAASRTSEPDGCLGGDGMLATIGQTLSRFEVGSPAGSGA